MLFNDPRSTERDNQNALRKYPFSDAASCTGMPGVIPPGAIVDAQLYVPGREPGRVWMSSIDTDGKLHFSDGAGEFAVLSAKATPDSAVPVTFTGDGGPCPGGVVVFGGEAAVSALLALGGQEFTAGQAELAPAAVSWPGLPGVLGFRLDDGHVVYGDVKIRGENGCVVSTYVEGTGAAAKSVLRISAMGRPVGSSGTTGFVTRVVFTSDNTNFVVAPDELSPWAVDVLATGVSTLTGMTPTLDVPVNTDQDDLCDNVRAKLGTVPSRRATPGAACGEKACDTSLPKAYYITLFDTEGIQVTWEAAEDGNRISAMDGVELKPLRPAQIPAVPAGKRFAGYYDESGTMYYRYDGTPVRRFTAGRNVSLHAKAIALSSRADVTFEGYGTLHIAAPSTPTYSNPLRISGLESPVPVVQERQDQAIEAGGADALADILLHPAVPAGEVRIGLRGADKAAML